MVSAMAAEAPSDSNTGRRNHSTAYPGVTPAPGWAALILMVSAMAAEAPPDSNTGRRNHSTAYPGVTPAPGWAALILMVSAMAAEAPPDSNTGRRNHSTAYPGVTPAPGWAALILMVSAMAAEAPPDSNTGRRNHSTAYPGAGVGSGCLVWSSGINEPSRQACAPPGSVHGGTHRAIAGTQRIALEAMVWVGVYPGRGCVHRHRVAQVAVGGGTAGCGDHMGAGLGGIHGRPAITRCRAAKVVMPCLAAVDV